MRSGWAGGVRLRQQNVSCAVDRRHAGYGAEGVASSDADKVHADWPGVKVMSAPGGSAGRPGYRSGGHRHPERHHFPLAKAALEAGKHVVVDKPLP